jgi:hypothetical protein
LYTLLIALSLNNDKQNKSYLCQTGRVTQSLGCELVGGVQQNSKEMPSAVLATAIQDRVTNAKHYFFHAAL